MSSENDESKFFGSLLQTFLFTFFCLPVVYPITAEKGQKNGVCVSPGGRFPKFSFEGHPPRKSVKGPSDLTSCRIFRKRTCCTAVQTHPILLSIRRLASEGEATQECLALWELLECSICDPRVGIAPGPPVICSSFCDSVLEACSDAYFSVDPISQVMMPCSSRDTLCGRATEWTMNGTRFCQLAGFSVIESGEGFTDSETSFCFDGRTSFQSLDLDSLESRVVSDISTKGKISAFLWQMNTVEWISWTLGAVVFTIGVIFMSKRRSHSSRQKQLALQRTKSMLEARAKQQSAIQATASKKNKSGKKR